MLKCGGSMATQGLRLTSGEPLSSATTAPWQVRAAVAFVAGACLVALLRAILMKDWTRPLPAAAGILLMAAISLIWLYGLWRRLNWLRWATVILGGGGSFIGLWGVARLGDPVQTRLYWIQFSLLVPAAVLLLLPAVRMWYSSAKQAE